MSYSEIIARCMAEPFFFLCCLSWVSIIVGGSFWLGVFLAKAVISALVDFLRQLRRPRR